jgi:sortase A
MLLTIAIAALGYTAYVYVDSAIYQAREDQIFEDQPAVTAQAPATDSPTANPPAAAPTDPTLVGRIMIPRLNVKAVVQEGVDSKTLRRAVGHVPGTALPGQDGNVALAAHRDSFFRGLRDVKKNDLIQMETFDRNLEYVVDSTEIVQPSDVRVLAPTRDRMLTLVTCYPFNYIGHAPKRFIVRAREVSVSPRETRGS